jgi:hypothetical protein
MASPPIRTARPALDAIDRFAPLAYVDCEGAGGHLTRIDVIVARALVPAGL